MNIITAFKAQIEHEKAAAQERAKRQLAKARTDAERDRERAKIQKERLQMQREINEAKIAVLKSESARKRAAQEVKDLGGGFFGSTRKALAPKKVAAVHHKVVHRKKPVAKKRAKGKSKSFRFSFD
jgi:lipid II:glycine glycyltransferase (peptidoglycan interpeptide bridge formation enzyme)